MSQGHKDWKAGDKAMYRGLLVEVVGKTLVKVSIKMPGRKRATSVFPQGLTEVEDARESEE